MSMERRQEDLAVPGLGSEAARPAGRERLATVRRDFFLDPSARLTEQERALMGAMLDDLIASMATAIETNLPGDGRQTPGSRDLQARLARAGLLDRPGVIGLLLQRSDEQRLASSLQLHSPHGRPALMQRWVVDEDADVAAGAMALMIARGNRRDSFGQPRLLFDDLPAEEAVELTYALAAAMASDAADPEVVAAAEALLMRHDEGQRMEALLAGFVRLLERAGRLDDPTIEDCVAEGEVALLSAMLARRAAVPDSLAWDHIAAGGDGRLVLLARMAGLSRPTAARLLADLGPLTTIDDPATELERFDRLSDEEVARAQGMWRLPPAYRRARECFYG